MVLPIQLKVFAEVAGYCNNSCWNCEIDIPEQQHPREHEQTISALHLWRLGTSDTHGVDFTVPQAFLTTGELLEEAAVAKSNNDLLWSALYPLPELASSHL